MARMGETFGRRSAVVISVAAIGAIGTAVVLQDQPSDTAQVSASGSAVDASAQVMRDGFEGDDAGGAPVPPVDACADPLVQPAGFEAVAQSWEKTWTSKRTEKPLPPVMHFPNSPGFPVGIGAGRNQYLLTEFTPPDWMTAQLFWDGHQARPQEGEGMGRPALSMFVSITPCAGDLRMRGWCSRVANTGAISWTTKYVPPGAAACQLQPGVTHYLIVAPVDPTDGSVADDYTCADPNAPFCWVQAAHRPQI